MEDNPFPYRAFANVRSRWTLTRLALSTITMALSHYFGFLLVMCLFAILKVNCDLRSRQIRFYCVVYLATVKLAYPNKAP